MSLLASSSGPFTDRDLVACCVARDAAALAAFGELYDRHHQIVAAFAYRLHPDPLRADELVEATFRTLWARAHCFHDGPEQLDVRAWLLGLARYHYARVTHQSFVPLPIETECMETMAAGD